VFLLLRNFNTFNRVLGLILAGTFLFLNLKAWDNRFFLYLVPFMGAGVASLLALGYAKLQQKQIAGWFWLALLGSTIFSLQFLKDAVSKHFSEQPFEAVAAAKMLQTGAASPQALVIARKPHLSFYANLNGGWFPEAETIGELRSVLADTMAKPPVDRKIYLFYGYAEKHYRPKLAALGSPDFDAPWLDRIGGGRENGGWVLYELRREGFHSAARQE
jgi:hypothetical protein